MVSRNFDRDIDHLAKGLEEVRAVMAGLTRRMDSRNGAAIEDDAEGVLNRAAVGARRLGEEASGLARKSAAGVRAGASTIKGEIDARPLTSVAIAAAAGYLAGRFLGR